MSEKISFYSFPGIKRELLDKKKYPYLFTPAELKITRKEILEIIHEKGIQAGMPIGKVNLNELEKLGFIKIQNSGSSSYSHLGEQVYQKI
jgi:hypothetical protein